MRPSSWEDILGLPAQMEAARPLKNAEKHRAKSGLSKFSGDVYLFMYGYGYGSKWGTHFTHSDSGWIFQKIWLKFQSLTIQSKFWCCDLLLRVLVLLDRTTCEPYGGPCCWNFFIPVWRFTPRLAAKNLLFCRYSARKYFSWVVHTSICIITGLYMAEKYPMFMHVRLSIQQLVPSNPSSEHFPLNNSWFPL